MICDATETAETSIELLREFELTGDAAVFEIFMRRHASMVYATCLKVTRDPHDAEDATQATFLTLASKSKLNGEIRQPEAWLRKVAHRLSLDLIRSKKRRVNRENARSEMSEEAAPLDSYDHADQGEVKGILNEELAKLPASYRMPLVLHYFGGLSREEMAAQLKLKPSTLGVRLHRAREQLRKRLSNRGVLLPSVALTALLTDSVRFAVSEQLVAATAQQASAIVFGQATLASASPMAISAAAWAPSAGFIHSVTDVIVRSKVKLIASALVLGSALGAANAADIARFVPAVVREWLPTFAFPRLTLPKFENPIPLPTFSAKPAEPTGVDSPAVAAVPSRVSPGFGAKHAVSIVDAGRRASVAPTVIETSSLTSFATLTVPSPTVLARIDVGFDPRPLPEASRTSALSLRSPTPAASPARAAPSEPNAIAQAGPARTENGKWGVIIEDGVPASAGGSASNSDAPEELIAATVGVSPLSGGSGGGGGGGSAADAGGGPKSVPQVSALASRESRTVVFAGTSANYGGYSDDAWQSSAMTDLSGTLSSDSEAMSFNQPAAPSQGLSLNGARVTLHGVDADATVDVSFLDTESAAYPTLPGGHHFIGAWSLDASAAFDSAELVVRYDDLRAARLGLSEQILKLWVSDGTSWTLMWHDPSFGRDVHENLIWVTADGGFKYFAVSAPEPGTMLVCTLALAGLATRRRR